MQAHRLTFQGQTLHHHFGRTWTLKYPIAAAAAVGDVVVVLYDYMAGPTHRQFRNVEGFDHSGRKLWTAEHPTNTMADSYVEIVEMTPLVLGSFAGFRCTIDPATGRLVETIFTK